MNARPCPDDLLVASRRRWLSDLERKALSAHLARCELCRAGEHAAALMRGAFAEGGEVSAADGALVERVADRASASLSRGGRRTGAGGRRVAIAVVAFLCLGGVASAWIGRSWVAPPAPDRAPPAGGSFVRPRVFHKTSPVIAPVTPPPPVVPSHPSAAPSRHVAIRPIHEDLAGAAAPETAASLFAAATAARRDGDLRRAVSLYEALHAGFPDSAEARVSAVSRGDLLLRLEEPARALRAFDEYLSEVRVGALREEALFGRARCAQKLRDEPAERSTWSRLVQESPGSAYGSIARQRLDELRRGE